MIEQYITSWINTECGVAVSFGPFPTQEDAMKWHAQQTRLGNLSHAGLVVLANTTDEQDILRADEVATLMIDMDSVYMLEVTPFVGMEVERLKG